VTQTADMAASRGACGRGGWAAEFDPIVIVGGRLGGLTTALAQRGRPVRVLKGVPQFGAIGS
jgi:hypothetical protein